LQPAGRNGHGFGVGLGGRGEGPAYARRPLGRVPSQLLESDALAIQGYAQGLLRPSTLRERTARVLERAARGVRQRAVEHVQQGVVLPERKAKRDRKGRHADDQSHAQLVEMREDGQASFVADRLGDHVFSGFDAGGRRQ
jgi:hypothetical protein